MEDRFENIVRIEDKDPEEFEDARDKSPEQNQRPEDASKDIKAEELDRRREPEVGGGAGPNAEHGHTPDNTDGKSVPMDGTTSSMASLGSIASTMGSVAENGHHKFRNFFRHGLGSNPGDSDDRGHRAFLKKRDTHNSTTGSSMENVSSADSNSTGTDDTSYSNASRKSTHLSLRRFLKIFKPDESHLFHNHRSKEKDKDGESEKKSKDRNHGHQHGKRLHILPQHPGSELYRKYTKGKLIGSGASGLVNLVHLRTDPSKVYAVKKFRPKLPNEAESDYKIKVNNEYKVGEILNHENLIKTIELVKENTGLMMFSNAEYYMIMEYCPFDFFNLVMSGLMDQKEINCYFKQIINGVAHLHDMGLAHRDLKLDNCVVDDQGILKLIDFGSAVQFRKLVEHETRRPEKEIITINGKAYRLLLSRGIVGSDPYLSPEVLDQDVEVPSQSRENTPTPNYEGIGAGSGCGSRPGTKSDSHSTDSSDDKGKRGYDARKVDVWSIAIIYCCMVLRRFPWKIPQDSDPSYKGFSKNRHRLFKLLPKESHDLMNHMLTDKQERYLIEQVVQHPYVETIASCTADHKIEDHKHHLITESELDQINRDRDRVRKLKQAGMA